MPPSKSVASFKRSAARRASASLCCGEVARRMSSVACLSRSSACWTRGSVEPCFPPPLDWPEEPDDELPCAPLCEFFLAARQLIELLKRFVDVFITLAGRTGGLRRFVLILFRVELEIKQAREVAPRAASRTATPAAAAKRYLNLAERGLGAQQVLEGFLFVRKSILPFLLLQFFGGWAHGVGSRVHVLHKTVEFLVFLAKLAALHSPRQ